MRKILMIFLSLFLVSGFAFADGLIIDQDGNVRVGSASYPKAQLDVQGQIIGGFGAKTTNGTLDWNDLSNTRAGSGYTLLLGTASNGPSGGYFHPFNFEYGSKNGGGNITQFAIPYAASMGSGMYMRGRYSGVWSNWMKIITEFSPGKVGLGRYPSYNLDVNGTARVTTLIQSSDERLKKNIHSVNNSLDKLSQIRGVSYEWKDTPPKKERSVQDEDTSLTATPAEKISTPEEKKTRLGLLAQEVEQVFPEAVYTDGEGMKSIAYSQLIAPMIEAIKNLNMKIADLEQRNALQERELAYLKSHLHTN